MGLSDRLHRRKPDQIEPVLAQSALAAARAGQAEADAITYLIQQVLSLGLDGRGFFKGSVAVAEIALGRADGDVEKAIGALTRSGLRQAGAGGFVTSVGGFVLMPVAIPANLLEFYVFAARTVGAIAVLRGYDLTDPAVRTAVLLTMVGSRSNEILKQAGVDVSGVSLGGLAQRGLPSAAQMIVQKAVGFRLLRSVGERTLVRFGRAVPILGGGIGGLLDGAMMSRIAHQAKQEFPPQPGYLSGVDWGVR